MGVKRLACRRCGRNDWVLVAMSDGLKWWECTNCGKRERV